MSRRLDLSQFRGDSSDEEVFPPPKKRTLELDALKSKTFSYGVTRKTKLDIEREAAERKRIEDEKLAQIALEEFSQAFEGDGQERAGPKGRRGNAFVKAGQLPQSAPYRLSAPRQPDQESGAARGSTPPPPVRLRGKRAMDAFLEEIKRYASGYVIDLTQSNQETREAKLGRIAQREGRSVTSLAALGGPSGPGQIEAESTNLFIGNLPQTVSEETLGKLFAKAGDVGTVKIMWPRDHDHHRSRSGLTGFVCFMRRKDAERAIHEYDGFDWNGNQLRVTWSKAVPLPRKAIYELLPGSRRGNRLQEAQTDRNHPQSSSPDPGESTSDGMVEALERRRYWLSRVEPEQQEFLKAVASRVRDHGKGLLNSLRSNERGNPKFNFLFDVESSEYHMFSYLLDEDYRFPPARVVTFEDDGYASFYSSDSSEERDQKDYGKAYLGKLARRRFEAMLRGMTGKRVEIARAMEFALKHAEAAGEVVDTICQSLCIDDTPVPRKIARLHLISDILHNSASPLPNVWRYRQAFEMRLDGVFAHLADVHRNLLEHAGTMSANVFRQQVEAVIAIWERWFVFTTDVLERLDRLLHSSLTLADLEQPASVPVVDEVPQTQVETAGFKSSFKRIPASTETADTPAETMAEDEDLDGEALDSGIDGEAMDEDVDGEEI